MKKEELITLALDNEKRFYKAKLVAVQKRTDDGLATDGKITDGEFTEYYAVVKDTKIYEDGKAKELASATEATTEETDASSAVATGSLKKEEIKEAAANTDKTQALPAAKIAKPSGYTFTRNHKERIFYHNGKEIGRLQLDEIGNILSQEGQAITGDAKEFYPNGSLRREVSFKDGKPEGKGNAYDTNGRLIATEFFKDGLREGKVNNFTFQRGILTEEKANYSKGKLNGKREFFGLNGVLLSAENYVNNMREGEQKTFHFDGALETSTFFSNDIMQGLRTFFYDSGKTMYSENLAKGLLQGKRKGFYPSGKIYLEENYKDNLLDGERIVYKENGEIKSKEVYKNGALIK
ncbi:MAG: toxin-antitoxin system YwqK family antitoxin [Elusimicrobiota bacterium]|nr:toxin-antitoxin system YwqK family antitoxin [Elusimicrobiota bacterium]